MQQRDRTRLFCRLNFLLVMAPRAMAIMAVVGAITAMLAALIAFAQTDLKKVLAYSTVSQLGIMFMGLGGGVFWAAFLHVVTHAMFKACLFLGAGSVMHGNNNEGDATKLGGLRDQMPATHLTFLAATLTITGMVPLSGFFSKDAILHAAGLTRRHLVSVRIHLVDFERLIERLNKAYVECIGAGDLPARTCVGVAQLTRGALVEMDFVVRTGA